MKKTISIILILSIALCSLCCAKKSGDTEELIIHAGDSFLSEWGLAPVVFPLFEEKYGIKIRTVRSGSTGEILSRTIMEKEAPSADIVIGIDNNMLSAVLKADILKKYRPAGIEKIDQELIFDKSCHIIPFDYGFFAIVYDSRKIADPPKSMEDLLKSEYKKSLIIMDPRTSSPGLGFLLWTKKTEKEDFKTFWKKLMPNILTISESWSSGYGLFTAGEAPMVLSYTTSPAYHTEYENSDYIKTVLFSGGNYMQTEGAGIVKNCRHLEAAELFMDFILTDDFQKAVPLANWMYPVTDVPLPDSFSSAPKAVKSLLMDHDMISENLDRWISEWLECTAGEK